MKAVVEAANDWGHWLLGNGLFPDAFVYLGKTEGWFAFEQPRWKPLKLNVQHLRRKISNELHAHYVSAAVAALREEEVEPFIDIKLVERMLLKLANVTFQNNLVKVLRSMYYEAYPVEWLAKLDADDMLLGFDDAVYDFNEKAFRDGRPSDMVSLSTGHKRKAVEVDEEISGKIRTALESMRESEGVYEYVLHFLSTSVVGPLDRSQIWTGTGGDDKGLTKHLAASAFGEYYYELKGLFAARTRRRVLCPELVKLKGKRVCISSGAEPGSKLRAGLLKACTGHDLIQARDRYKTASESEFRKIG